VSNLTKESIKCSNAPQHPNKFSKGFKCCHYHVNKLLTKGLNVSQIDKYIDWKWYKKELKSTQDKLGSTESNDKKNIEKYTKKITKIENSLKKEYTLDETNIFEKVSRYGIVPRKSSRIQSNKEKANLNELIIMENDSETLQLFEDWLGEKVHPDLIHYKKRMYYIYIFVLHHLTHLVCLYCLINRIIGNL